MRTALKATFARAVFLVSGLALLLDGLALTDFVLHPLAQDTAFQSALYRAVILLVLMPLTVMVGFLIIRRVPGNVVGPLLIVWSASVAYQSIRADLNPWLFAAFAWYDQMFGWFGLFLVLAHFPDGEIYPAWATRWIYGTAVLTIFIMSLFYWSTPLLDTPTATANPLFIPALLPWYYFFLGIALVVFSPVLVLAMVAPVLRYRKGTPRERLQIKWLAVFGGVIILYIFGFLIIIPLLTGKPVMQPGTDFTALIFFLGVGLFPPAAIGTAILRHRLWDIDILIRRTLVYTILTGIVTLLYFGSVGLLQSIFTRVIGQQSPAAVALSTLAIAASITPLHRRIRDRVDRSFFRKKYNSEQVLIAFSTGLRGKVDLDQLTNSILGVINETMQPANVSLWLREADPRPGKHMPADYS